MRLTGTLAAVTCAVMLTWMGPEAQSIQRPNFTGSWTLQHVAVDPRMRTGSGPDFLSGATMVVEHDATSLGITQSKPRVHPKLTLLLDRSDSHNVLPSPSGGSPSTFVTRAMWERDTLVIENVEPWIFTMRWSMTPSGQLSIHEIAPNIEQNPSATHALYSRQ